MPGRRGVTAFLTGILVCLALTAVPAYLWFTRQTDGSEFVLWYGFLDKRWLVALYFIWVVGLPVSVMAAAWFLRRESPLNRPEPRDAGVPQVQESHRWPRRLSGLLALVVALAMAWFLWGPPWGGGTLGGPVDIHDSVNYKGVQAVLSGSLPYIDAASNQYGPLSQVLLVEWLQHVGPVSIAGIRTSDLMRHFTAIVFFILASFTFLRAKTALVASAAMLLLFPAVNFFQLTATGPSGFWGWANLWRYAGVYLIGLGVVVLGQYTRTTPRRLLLVTLGLLWGITALLAQENLMGGLVALIVTTLMLALSRRISVRSAAAVALWVAAGFMLTWTVYLLPYLSAGRAADFLHNYFVTVRGVSAGYSNTEWSGPAFTILFWVGPLLVLVMSLTLVFSGLRETRASADPVLAFKRPSADWIVPYGIVVAASAAQAGSLTRSDDSHLINSYVIFPIAVSVFVVWSVTRSGGAFSKARVATGVLVGSVALIATQLGTSWALLNGSLLTTFSAAIESRGVAGAPVSPDQDQRIDSQYLALPQAVSFTEDTPAQVVELSKQLKDFIGERPTLVDPDMAYVFGNQLGYLYFIADLKPFELPYEDLSVAFTRGLQNENLQAVYDLDRPLCALVTSKPDSPFSQAALARMGPTDSISIPFHYQTEVTAYRCRDREP